jgi:hypothetical protein
VSMAVINLEPYYNRGERFYSYYCGKAPEGTVSNMVLTAEETDRSTPRRVLYTGNVNVKFNYQGPAGEVALIKFWEGLGRYPHYKENSLNLYSAEEEYGDISQGSSELIGTFSVSGDGEYSFVDSTMGEFEETEVGHMAFQGYMLMPLVEIKASANDATHQGEYVYTFGKACTPGFVRNLADNQDPTFVTTATSQIPLNSISVSININEKVFNKPVLQYYWGSDTTAIETADYGSVSADYKSWSISVKVDITKESDWFYYKTIVTDRGGNDVTEDTYSSLYYDASLPNPNKHPIRITPNPLYANSSWSNRYRDLPTVLDGYIMIETFKPEQQQITVRILASDGRLIKTINSNGVDRQNEVSLSNGIILWDLLGDDGTRASSGVYYIVVNGIDSTGDEYEEIAKSVIIRN